MCKISITLLIIMLGLSSCRPSYMRCPKNRRCIVLPTAKENIASASNLNVIDNKQYTSSF